MKPLHKTTIVIWSEFDATGSGIEYLTKEAVFGDAFCSKEQHDLVEDPESDPDWKPTDFFDDP